jgi:hypothetical protein
MLTAGTQSGGNPVGTRHNVLARMDFDDRCREGDPPVQGRHGKSGHDHCGINSNQTLQERTA